jgi:MraZ protein
MQYFMRRVFSAAVPCETDKNGRVMVPYELRQNAGIANDIVIVGLMDKLELWDKQRWDAITDPDKIDVEAFARKLSEYGI